MSIDSGSPVPPPSGQVLHYDPVEPALARRNRLQRLGLSPDVDRALFSSIVLLIIRLAWGWELVESGYGHITHIPDTIEAFKGWGVPLPSFSVHVSAITELTGGILIMLGLAARFISVPLVFNFLVAYLTASRDELTHVFKQDPSHIVDDSAFPFLITSLLMIAFGAGRLSLDYLILRAAGLVKDSPPQ
jgi:putative oxidoreductase